MMEPPSPSRCNQQQPLKWIDLCRTTKICFLATFFLAYVRKQLLTSLRQEGGKSLTLRNLISEGHPLGGYPPQLLYSFYFLSTDSLYRWRNWVSGRRRDLPWSHGPFCSLILLLINFLGCKDVPEAFLHPTLSHLRLPYPAILASQDSQTGTFHVILTCLLGR